MHFGNLHEMKNQIMCSMYVERMRRGAFWAHKKDRDDNRAKNIRKRFPFFTRAVEEFLFSFFLEKYPQGLSAKFSYCFSARNNYRTKSETFMRIVNSFSWISFYLWHYKRVICSYETPNYPLNHNEFVGICGLQSHPKQKCMQFNGNMTACIGV